MAGPGFGQPGTYTPLQLIAGAGLLQNQGISVPTSLTDAVSSYNSLPFVQDLMSTISLGPGFGLNAGVIASLKTLGNTTCPALGASIPAAYAGVNPLIPTTETGGFGHLVTDNAALYLGDGQVDRFCQAYQIVVGYRAAANELICSAVNATTYLGPTFTTMNDLITGQFTGVNLALKCLGRDLAQLGNAINLAKLDDFGTPAAMLQQLSDEAKITAGTLSCVALKLAEYGLTESDIVLLCTPSASTRTPTMNEFNALQKKAYQAMIAIDADCLTYVLDVLGVVTPNINTMADLLDLKKILPESWISLTIQSTAPPPPPPSPGSPPASELTTNPLENLILIFNTDGSVNPVLQTSLAEVSAQASAQASAQSAAQSSTLSSGQSAGQSTARTPGGGGAGGGAGGGGGAGAGGGAGGGGGAGAGGALTNVIGLTNGLAITLPGGCDELAKIIPPDQAVASKAFQIGLQNIGGISTTTLPRVATALLG